MNDPSTLLKKRIKVIRECTIIMMFYAAFIMILFALQAFDVIKIFSEVSLNGTMGTFVTLVICSCVLGIVIGVLCFIKIKAPEWYGKLTFMFFCYAILNVILIIAMFSNNLDNRMVIIVFIQVPFACVAGLALNRLKANLTKDN